MPSTINHLDLFLGKKIKSFRVQKKWPLKKLAEEIGVSIQQMQRYEQSINKISATMLFDLARIFSISINCFFEGFGNQGALNPTHLDDNACNILLVHSNSKDEYILRSAIYDFPEKMNIYSMNSVGEMINYCKNIGDCSNLLYTLKPDLIIIDLNISNIEMNELLRIIRGKKALELVPLLILTDNSNEHQLEQSYLYANSFIKKSLSYTEYKDQLHEMLNYWIKVVSLPTTIVH